MNNYDFDYNHSAFDTVVRSIVNVAVFAGAALGAWALLIGIDRVMGFLGML